MKHSFEDVQMDGAFTQDRNKYNTFPGPVYNTQFGEHVTSVFLWVRVASFADMFDFRICTFHCRRSSHFGFRSALLLIVIYS